MQKMSIRQNYFYSLVCYIFVFACGIAGGIVVICHINEFVGDGENSLGWLFVIGLLVAFLALIILSVKKAIVLLKDYNDLKRGNFISITGKVRGFLKNREPESGVQINSMPIVMVEETEEIILNINDHIVLGETYTFNYLKNSRIAEITKK